MRKLKTLKQVRELTNHRNLDIVCPNCKGMLEDISDSNHLYCPQCKIEWRV